MKKTKKTLESVKSKKSLRVPMVFFSLSYTQTSYTKKIHYYVLNYDFFLNNLNRYQYIVFYSIFTTTQL